MASEPVFTSGTPGLAAFYTVGSLYAPAPPPLITAPPKPPVVLMRVGPSTLHVRLALAKERYMYDVQITATESGISGDRDLTMRNSRLGREQLLLFFVSISYTPSQTVIML